MAKKEYSSEALALFTVIARREDSDPSLLETIFNEVDDDDLRFMICENSSFSAKKRYLFFQEKVKSSDEDIRNNVARSEQLELAHQEVLINDNGEGVRATLASNKKLNEKFIASLAADADDDVRASIAENPAVSKEILVKMSADENERVRNFAAANLGNRLSQSDIERLAADSNEGIRYRLAGCDFLNDGSLKKILKDKSWSVRAELAKNPHLKWENVAVLLADKNVAVVGNLLSRPDCPPEVFNENIRKVVTAKNHIVRWAALSDARCPEDLRLEFGKGKDEFDRCAVAENPVLIGHLVDDFVTDKSINVRKKLAMNEACPAAVLGKLAADKKVEVRRAVAANASITNEIAVQLSKDKEHLVRFSLAQNRGVSSDFLVQLADDKEAIVRQSVLRNSNTSLDLVIKLASDASEEVRVVAYGCKKTPSGLLAEKSKKIS